MKVEVIYLIMLMEEDDEGNLIGDEAKPVISYADKAEAEKALSLLSKNDCRKDPRNGYSMYHKLIPVVHMVKEGANE